MTKAEEKEERLIIRLMQEVLFGKTPRSPRPEQIPRARAHALKHRIWEHGRIGRIETAISRETISGQVFTTGQLVRAIYHNRFYNDDLNAPPVKLKAFHYQRIRLSAPTFCDLIGRDNHRPGRPYLWKARGEDFYTVRNRKTKRDRIRRQRKPA